MPAWNFRDLDYIDVEKCQTEGFDWQNFIRTDKKLIFLLHILLFGLTRFSRSVKMTGMSKKISTSLRLILVIGAVFLKRANFVSFTDKNVKCPTEIKILSVRMSDIKI